MKIREHGNREKKWNGREKMQENVSRAKEENSIRETGSKTQQKWTISIINTYK